MKGKAMTNKTSLANGILPLWLFLAAAMCAAALIDYVVNAKINVVVIVLGLVFLGVALGSMLGRRAQHGAESKK